MRNLWSFILLSLLATVLCAQERPPELLSNAAHCLVIEKQDWLGLGQSKAEALKLGYVEDTKSYPGEKHLFVVAYTGEHKGRVFDIRVEPRGAKQRFTIQNNASFRSTKGRVSFIDPPLGGVWTTEHLQSAVQRIELGPKVMIPTEDLRGTRGQIECRSYADK